MKFSVTTTIDVEDIQDSIADWDNDTTLEFILAMDLAVADAGFSELLIKRLTKSLQGDLSREDYLTMIEELRNL